MFVQQLIAQLDIHIKQPLVILAPLSVMCLSYIIVFE